MNRQTLKPDVIYLVDYKPVSNNPDLIPRVKEGVRKAKADGFEYCYIIENDDYYPDDYFENMQFGEYDFIGTEAAGYYSLNQKMFTHADRRKTRNGTCLAFTAFRISKIEKFTWPRDDLVLLDVKLWKFFRLGNFHVYTPESMPISIKHGVGLCVTNQHKMSYKYEIKDMDLFWLRHNTREESFEFYKTINV